MAIKNNTIAPKGGPQGRRDRYWSLMLVGEHGRIIPVRHVKGIAILLLVTLVSALIALGILLFFYLRQSADLEQLRTNLADTTKQLAQLRDEKDMLLAKLVIENKIPIEKKAAAPAADDKKEASEAPAIQQPPEREPAAEPAPPPAPVPEAKPVQEKPPEPPPAPVSKVKWGADISNFKVDYEHQRSILQAVFKIYNTSRPKEPLSGRAVVVFKQGDEMPMKWLAVPRVQLENGTPSGKNGQAFKINNYRTMNFKAFGLKPPIDYDTAVVFVFTADGEMIRKEEFGFKVELPPPPPPKAPEPSPPADDADKKPANQTEEQPPQTLFPLQPSGSGSKLPPILQNSEPIQLEPEKTTEDSPAPAPEEEATQTPAPAESSPTQPEGEKE